MRILETFDRWASDGTLVMVGVMMLVGIFVACFFLKTFWGRWDDRAKEKQIYGEPRGKSPLRKKDKRYHDRR